VDEIYDRLILTPLVLLSRHVLWAVVDAQIIDGLVNGVASTASWFGRAHGRIGSGRVQAYAVGIAAGAAIIVTAYALGS
jgi:NADH-quinone oxidoreductase subunit L